MNLLIYLPVLFMGYIIIRHLFPRRTDRKTAEQSATEEKNIIYPDPYAKQYIDRVHHLEKSGGIEDYLDREIGLYFPFPLSVEHIWVSKQVFLSTILPCSMTGNIADDYYHVSHSRYALLDFSICAYFSMRIPLCACAKREFVEESDTLFLDLLVRYFRRNFSISEAEVNAIIDSRLEVYERIMRITPEDRKEEELIRTLADFIAADFDSDPLDYAFFIAPIDKTYRLYGEICTIMRCFYEL